MLSFLHQHLEGLLAKTSASAYWKDCDGKYLGINDNFIEVCGVHSADNMIGSTDRDQIWKDDAAYMIQNDNRVMMSESVITDVEKSLSPKGHVVHFLSHKSPLRNKSGKVIGTFGLSYELENTAWNTDIINEVNMIVGTQGAEYIKQYLLTLQKNKHQLSKRQTDCLHYLTKGLTIRQIAQTLSLSHRTVEHYLETVKAKLNCTSRSELIAKAFELNLN